MINEQINQELLEACIEATALFDNYPACFEAIGTYQVLHNAIRNAIKALEQEQTA